MNGQLTQLILSYKSYKDFQTNLKLHQLLLSLFCFVCCATSCEHNNDILLPYKVVVVFLSLLLALFWSSPTPAPAGQCCSWLLLKTAACCCYCGSESQNDEPKDAEPLPHYTQSFCLCQRKNTD